MPFNGSGIFNLIYNWEADAAANIDIMASRMDQQEADMASSGFDNCLTRDGQGQPTANLPMAGFRHTNVANAVNRTDYAALGQVQDDVGINWVAAAGSSDAITATFTPALTALTDGQLAFFRASAANTTTTPTFSPNSLTAHTITKFGGAALAVGDIPAALAECILRYNLANTRWELLNPATNTALARTAVNDAAYVVLTTDRIVAYTAISAARAVTLCSAASYPSGAVLTVVDESGSCSTTNTITVNRAGSDLIASIGTGTSFVLNGPFASFQMESNGSNQWTVIGRSTNILVDQTLIGGTNVVSFSLGTLSTGNITIDPGKGPLQFCTNGGSFTFRAPENDGACEVLVTNNGSAGTISFSFFSVGSNTGEALDTINGHAFIITFISINSTPTYFIKALQ